MTDWSSCEAGVGTVWTGCAVECVCVRASFTAPDNTPIDGVSYTPEECDLTGQNSEIVLNEARIGSSGAIGWIAADRETRDVSVKFKFTTLVNSEGIEQFFIKARGASNGDIGEGAGIAFILDRETPSWVDDTGNTQIGGITADIESVEFTVSGSTLTYTLKDATDTVQATGTETIVTAGTGTIINFRTGSGTLAAIDDLEICPL